MKTLTEAQGGRVELETGPAGTTVAVVLRRATRASRYRSTALAGVGDASAA